MSSGAKVVTSYALQTDVKVVPTTGWKVLPYSSNTLNNSNELTESNTITDKRLKSAGIVTSGEVSGDIETELMFGVFDDLIAAGFWNNWQNGSTGQPSTLTISDVRKSFAIAKDFTDINVYHVFTGCHVDTFKLDVTTSDIIKATFGIKGLGYQQSTTTSFAKTPTPAPNGAKASGISIGTIKVNDADIGVCVEALSFEVNNQAQIQKCLGDNIYGGNLLPMQVTVNGTLNIAYSLKAHQILENQRTGATISLEVPIKFSDTEKYVLKIPKMQVSGEIPSPSGTDLAVAQVNFNAVDLSPVIEKYATTTLA